MKYFSSLSWFYNISRLKTGQTAGKRRDPIGYIAASHREIFGGWSLHRLSVVA